MVATVQFKSCPESLSQNTKQELMSEHLCPMLMEHVGTFIQCEGSGSAGSCQTQASGILNGAAGESKFLVQAFSCSIDQLRPFSAYCSNARPSGGGVHRAKKLPAPTNSWVCFAYGKALKEGSSRFRGQTDPGCKMQFTANSVVQDEDMKNPPTADSCGMSIAWLNVKFLEGAIASQGCFIDLERKLGNPSRSKNAIIYCPCGRLKFAGNGRKGTSRRTQTRKPYQVQPW